MTPKPNAWRGISRDPIKHPNLSAIPYLYFYLRNQPTVQTDSLGLCGKLVVRALDYGDNGLVKLFTRAFMPHMFVILDDGTRLTYGGTTTGEDDWTASTFEIQLKPGKCCKCFTKCMKSSWPQDLGSYDSLSNNCEDAALGTIQKCGGDVPSEDFDTTDPGPWQTP